ncbi:MAG: HSP20 family protein [Bacteroidia bacterium]|jgi:HSP20 family protein
MTLTKFKPTRRNLLNDTFFPSPFDSVFSDLMRDTSSTMETFQTPKADVIENDKAFKISVEFAGFTKEDIKLDVNDNELVISGHKESKKEEDKDKYHLREFRSGKFKRSFYLPDTANVDKIEAELKNGLLEVVIPKKATTKVKEIAIK